MKPLLSILLLFFASTAFSSEDQRVRSSAHFGYAIEQASSTGFHKVGGSVVLLDATYLLSDDFEAGIRTTGSGGYMGEGQFHRMQTGPLFSYSIAKGWALQFALAYFSESATTPDGSQEYRSHGHAISVGWERLFEIAKNLSLGWGGYLSKHSGNLETISIQPTKQKPISKNSGTSQGLAISLKMKL